MTFKFATMTGRLALWGVASLAVATGAASAQARTVSVDIPQQELGRALSEFARQSNQQLLYSPDLVRGRQARPLQGTYAADEALRQLLNGTDIAVRTTSGGAFLLAAAQPLPEAAPAAPPSAETAAEPEDEDEIVVTGTLLRGIAPPGTEIISKGREEIAATGATTTNQMLADIPQISAFNELPQILPGSNTQLTVTRPRIRNIGGNDSGASATLILVDGHRVVGAGIRQTTADPDIIPPGVIERVEIIPDGGSSIYGADAVGGVINFITRRRFSGVQLDAKYGFADDYYQIDAYITAGHDWGSGSAYISYNFAKNDELLGGDRDYARRFDFINNRPLDTNCNPGNITIGTTSFALPGRVSNTVNRCDTSDFQTLYPAQKRHSFFAGFAQDFGDSIKFDMRGFFTRRISAANAGPFRSSNATIRNTNFFFAPIGAETSHNVSFSWEEALGTQSLEQRTALDEWGVTPTISIDLSSKWQFRGMLNYGRSTTEVHNPAINATLLDHALRGRNPGNVTEFGQQFSINPYDIAATNQQLLENITNFEFFSQNKQKLFNARAIVDGTLLTIPGGEIRLAVGAEYIKESVRPRQGNIVPGTEDNLLVNSASRNIKALFGEVFIPLRGSENNGPGMHSLSISLSGRYDDYSDFGSTFNPKIGITWEPLNWVKVRGAWGTSFNAPSLADASGAPDNNVLIIGFPIVASPFDPPLFPNQPLVALQGAFPGTRPQSAETVSLGVDVRPPFIPGLTASLTYYAVDFSDQIAIPPAFQPAVLFTFFTDLLVLGPTANNPGRPPITQAQLLALVGGLGTFPGSEGIPGLFDPGDPPVYVFIDARRRNLARLKVSGLDFDVNYRRPTSFGSIDARFAGTYELNRESQAFDAAPFVDLLAADNSRFRFTATAGANIGNFRAQVTWNHSHGYDLTPISTFAFQDHVSSFDVFNLFFRYDVKGEDLFKDLSFTLNINNVFDQDPPLLKGVTFGGIGGYTNGSTLGRLIQFGVNKKF